MVFGFLDLCLRKRAVSELGSAASFYKLDVRNNVEWKELAEYILELHGMILVYYHPITIAIVAIVAMKDTIITI